MLNQLQLTNISYHIIYHIISYRIISYHISYHIVITSYHITSYHIISYIMSYIISYHFCFSSVKHKRKTKNFHFVNLFLYFIEIRLLVSGMRLAVGRTDRHDNPFKEFILNTSCNRHCTTVVVRTCRLRKPVARSGNREGHCYFFLWSY